MKHIVAWTCVMVAGVLMASSAKAQDASTNAQRAEAVAAGLNCPICEGYTLRDCPLPICAQMREEIRVMLDEGSTEDDVVEHFVDLHGPQVLNMPPARGAFLAAWVMPMIVLAGGALLVVRALGPARRGGEPGNGAAASASIAVQGMPDQGSAEIDRLEALLAEREA